MKTEKGGLLMILFLFVTVSLNSYGFSQDNFEYSVKYKLSDDSFDGNTAMGKVRATGYDVKGLLYQYNETKNGAYNQTKNFTTANFKYRTEYEGNSASRSADLPYTMEAEKNDDKYVFDYWEVNGDRYTTNPHETTYRWANGSANNAVEYIAHFVKKGSLSVTVNNSEWGWARVNPADNYEGQSVTLSAGANNPLETAFENWTNSKGEVVSNFPTFSTTAVADVYTANFATLSMQYCQIRNRATGKYLKINDVQNFTIQGSDLSTATFNGSLITVDRETAVKDPGCVFDLAGTNSDGGYNNAILTSQGTSTNEKILKKSLSISPYGGAFSISFDYNGNNLYIKDNGEKVTIGARDAYALWDILPLTESSMNEDFFGVAPQDYMKKNNLYYTTLYTTFAYRLEDGVKAYYVGDHDVSFETKKVTCTEIKDVVPANTAVILECKTPGDASKNRLVPVADNDNIERVIGNGLSGYPWQGTYKTRSSVENGGGNIVYVLSAGSKHDHVGYYKYTGTNLSPNKAYSVIQATYEQNAKEMTFILGENDTATSIEFIPTEENKDQESIYDLQGRRVEKTSKGIYIVNGKKIVVK